MRTIIPSAEIESRVKALLQQYKIKEIVLGNGTTSSNLKNKLENVIRDSSKSSINIELVEEDYSTLEAEKRYHQENPPSGLKKILNIFLDWKPDKPLDDLVAVILAERYIQDKYKNGKK